jgi:hypothetical protein
MSTLPWGMGEALGIVDNEHLEAQSANNLFRVYVLLGADSFRFGEKRWLDLNGFCCGVYWCVQRDLLLG